MLAPEIIASAAEALFEAEKAALKLDRSRWITPISPWMMPMPFSEPGSIKK